MEESILQEEHKIAIDLSTFENGIYNYKIETDLGYSYIGRFVILK